MTRILTHVKRQAVGYLALFVALGGTGYAAVNLPRNSVGSKQLRNGSVGPSKLGSPIAGYVRDYIRIDAGGQISESRPAAKVIVWRTGSFQPGGTIQWSHGIPQSCLTLATTNSGLSPVVSASAFTESQSRAATTYVELSAPGQQVSVAIICPQA